MKTYERKGQYVRIQATVNGRRAAEVSAYTCSDELLHTDQFNLVDARARTRFVDELKLKQLPPAAYEEARDLACDLGTEIQQDRTRWAQAKEEDALRGTAEPVPPEYSDDALALAFTAKYAGTLCHTAPWKRWSEWDGTRWREDSTLHVFDLVRGVCREAAARCEDAKIASLVSSAKTVAAVERLARADRAHAAVVDEWDRDPWLLGTPGGVVDLRTGVLHPAQQESCLTKLTAVAPGGSCPRWHRFVTWACSGDEELVGFLRRFGGYCLTGTTGEHALVFLYGTGGNGKGVFLNTLARLLADYAMVSPMETFINSHTDRHPTELARLRGARFVTAQETERGRQWAESKLKALTGGDTITARFMRGDFFEFTPQFKLVIAGNYRPSLQSVDEAIRRRFLLVPFEQTITPAERDLDFGERLREEWPGILAWLIQGCLEWQQNGLCPPERVCAATQEYFSAEDSLGAWLEECCTMRSTQWESSAALYNSWKTWAERAGERPGTQKALSTALRQRGFQPSVSGHTNARGFVGLSVKTDTANAYQTR
jgi:putative DNA primase/helicase